MQPLKTNFRLNMLKKGPEINHFIAHQTCQMQSFLTQGGLQSQKTYEFRLNKMPEIKQFLLTKCKIFLGKLACKFQKSYIGLPYKFKLKRGLK